MKEQLVVISQPQEQSCAQSVFSGVKIALLVMFTYGLMIAMFKVCLLLQTCKGSIPESYMLGGGIILAIFVANVIFWGVLWCWGARKRQQLRRDVVERQLAMIRKEEQAEEEKDLEEERLMIEAKRRQAQKG